MQLKDNETSYSVKLTILHGEREHYQTILNRTETIGISGIPKAIEDFDINSNAPTMEDM